MTLPRDTKPYEKLLTEGDTYEVTVWESDWSGNLYTNVIHAELRGWEYDEDRGYLYVILWEIGKSRADTFYVGDILEVNRLRVGIFMEKNIFLCISLYIFIMYIFFPLYILIVNALFVCIKPTLEC